MDDYIDRKLFCEKFCRCNAAECAKMGFEKCPIFICPAADVEHVIRCKDCKWYKRDKQKGGFCRKPEASMWSPGLPIDELKPDDYCSRAKRKENINGN